MCPIQRAPEIFHNGVHYIVCVSQCVLQCVLQYVLQCVLQYVCVCALYKGDRRYPTIACTTASACCSLCCSVYCSECCSTCVYVLYTKRTRKIPQLHALQRLFYPHKIKILKSQFYSHFLQYFGNEWTFKNPKPHTHLRAVFAPT